MLPRGKPHWCNAAVSERSSSLRVVQTLAGMNQFQDAVPDDGMEFHLIAFRASKIGDGLTVPSQCVEDQVIEVFVKAVLPQATPRDFRSL